jgi:hypothetical protein
MTPAIIVGFVLLLVIVVFFVRQRRRKNRGDNNPDSWFDDTLDALFCSIDIDDDGPDLD